MLANNIIYMDIEGEKPLQLSIKYLSCKPGSLVILFCSESNNKLSVCMQKCKLRYSFPLNPKPIFNHLFYYYLK